MNKGAVIFDFDGVLADSFAPMLALNRDALGRLGRSLSASGYRRLFLGNIHGSLKGLMGNEAEARRLALSKARLFGKHYAKVRLFPFTPRLVRSLARGNRLGIVSSTPRRFIARLLGKSGLKGSFTAVYGSRAHSKRGELEKALPRLGRAAAETFFVTDTVGDIKVGRELGLRMLGVGWGFHSAATLKKAGAERAFRDPKALLMFLS